MKGNFSNISPDVDLLYFCLVEFLQHKFYFKDINRNAPITKNCRND